MRNSCLKDASLDSFRLDTVRNEDVHLGSMTVLLSNQGEKSIHFFHKSSFKKKVLKYGTPKPSYKLIDVSP